MITAETVEGKIIQVDKKDLASPWITELDGECNGRKWKMSDLYKANIIIGEKAETSALLESIYQELKNKPCKVGLIPSDVIINEEPQDSIHFLLIKAAVMAGCLDAILLEDIDMFLKTEEQQNELMEMLQNKAPYTQVFATASKDGVYKDRQKHIYRIEEIMQYKTDMKLRDLQGELPNGKRIKWKNIDPEVNILVGENGSGKTLILDAINGLEGIPAIYMGCGSSSREVSFEKSAGELAFQRLINSVGLKQNSGYEVLLYDDIESHLSMSKQKTIIDEMRKINPNVQLFITTHSPFIYGDKWIGKVVNVEDLLI